MFRMGWSGFRLTATTYKHYPCHVYNALILKAKQFSPHAGCKNNRHTYHQTHLQAHQCNAERWSENIRNRPSFETVTPDPDRNTIIRDHRQATLRSGRALIHDFGALRNRKKCRKDLHSRNSSPQLQSSVRIFSLGTKALANQRVIGANLASACLIDIYRTQSRQRALRHRRSSSSLIS